MNYAETLDYLFSRLPMFSRIGADAFRKDLTNTIALCEALGNPHTKFKSIHVAGTNGKGSSSHMLAAVLQTAGYKTGLYTSPHLHDFRERIKVNGAMCDEAFVIGFTQRIQPLIEKISPSFFEITVAMAFAWFAQQEVDIAVIEVGLGGRLDSTNIISPEICLITNIGLDHVQMLGDTLEKIAFEKAGIIKEGIPVVVGEVLPETRPVFVSTAEKLHAPLIVASEERYVTDWQQQPHTLEMEVCERKSDAHTRYQLDLTGIYQLKNLPGVLAVLHQLQQRGWQISAEHIVAGLSHVRKLTGLHGRWEIVHENPRVILDVGHNVDGIRQIKEQLAHSNYRQLHIVLGMVKDKDIEAVLALLPKQATYYFTQASIPRALDAVDLHQQAGSHGLQGHIYPNVNSAIREALTHAHAEDLLLVCGSVFLVGEVEPQSFAR